MRKLFETEYTLVTPSNSNVLSTSTNVRPPTRSLLDADFDEDVENFDELESYISERPVNKEIDVLSWWKVMITIFIFN